MADTVNVRKMLDGPRNVVYRFTNSSDGTGESDVKKIDISTLSVGSDMKTVPTSLALERAEWNVQTTDGGFVMLEWDATTDDQILILSGEGEVDYRDVGGFHDPKSTGSTGDIFLTTDSFAVGDSYTITTYWKKQI